MKKIIYLDNNATTQLDENILNIIIKNSKTPANPSSIHYYGREAKKKLIKSREEIASFFQVSPNEIIFTSGGTEGANLAIKGFLQNKKGHIITTDIEHACVKQTLNSLKDNLEITNIRVGKYGAPSPEDIEKNIKENTLAIIISAVNSETGVKANIDKIAEIALKYNIPYIVDGVALLGKAIFTIHPGISCMFFSAHKIHAPQGIGFAFIRSSFLISPIITGGHQEYQKRAGTENLASIMAFAEAIRLLKKDQKRNIEHIKNLRDLFESLLKKNLSKIIINGEAERICNTSNISFIGVDSDVFLICLDQNNIAASAGSACSSLAKRPSNVLKAMNLPEEIVKSSIRFSFSKYTTEEEIVSSVNTIVDIYTSLLKNK